MLLRVRRTDLFVLNMRTRMPFRYGIATALALPHLFLKLELEIEGGIADAGAARAPRGPSGGVIGLAADHLPPKWFTKHPQTRFSDDIAEMLEVIRSACAIAQAIGPVRSIFDLWRGVYEPKRSGAIRKKYSPLLWGFGASLVERASIDAFCRGLDHNFATAARENTLGIDLGQLHPELAGARPADLLPASPLKSIIVRHTIGMSDPLTDGEIPLRERLHDGLPQSLEAAIKTYGLTHFKIKLSGNADKDINRLRAVARLLGGKGGAGAGGAGGAHADAGGAGGAGGAVTLDANENYHSLEPFQELCARMMTDPLLKENLLHRLLYIEQPLHREVALSEDTCRRLLAWPGRPPMIIDESDDRLESLPQALANGYIGASHKNCKGVIKGIAAACLVNYRNRNGADGRWVISAEDLSNVGPVALPQDLAVIATLGIPHAERNGHHYFRGLAAIPRGLQHELLEAHRDLYRDHEDGFATVNIRGGAIDVSSIVHHAFGLAINLDPAIFIPLDQWDPASLS